MDGLLWFKCMAKKEHARKLYTDRQTDRQTERQMILRHTIHKN